MSYLWGRLAGSTLPTWITYFLIQNIHTKLSYRDFSLIFFIYNLKFFSKKYIRSITGTPVEFQLITFTKCKNRPSLNYVQERR